MARGWESKAVADQIEEGNSRRSERDSVHLSPEARKKQEQLQSLFLSRSRLIQQLERAKHPSHRGVLLSGLKAIESEIEQLSAQS
jgi:seryl-tRNA synthetase